MVVYDLLPGSFYRTPLGINTLLKYTLTGSKFFDDSLFFIPFVILLRYIKIELHYMIIQRLNCFEQLLCEWINTSLRFSCLKLH